MMDSPNWRDQVRASVRRNAEDEGPGLRVLNLRAVADAIDTLREETGAGTRTLINFATAERLRILAERIEAGDSGIVEQLAKANAAAAEAQTLAEFLSGELQRVDQDNAELRAAVTNALRETRAAVAAYTEERRHNQIAQRTISYLLDAIETLEEDAHPQVVFQVGEDLPDGVTIEHAADIALACVLNNGGTFGSTT